VFDADRAVSATGAPEVENRLDGRNTAWGLYFTDTVTLGAETHLTLAGRYNHTRVVTRDRLNPAPPNLDADFTYRKFNPALGLTHAPQPGWQLYANLSQGSRAPTPIELGCADAANPCTLPNALVSDPFLEQVVTRTVEAGLRGGGKTLNWHAGAFRSTNYDDILFVSTSTSAGFFTNFGRTRRQGLELDLGGAGGGWDWRVDYSLVDATFESPALLVSPNNSTRGIAPGAADDEIAVRPGDRIPGIPRHSLKLAVDKALAEGWRLGASLLAFSYQFVRGNENNRHQAGSFTDSSGETRSFQGPGTVPGYALLNLRASWRAARDWELFARLDNVFDKRYFTGGALAENPFDAAGDFLTNSEDWARETFLAPGAPRALWLGVRFSPDLR
jgi:outer membrane receptor protein involved in Fe transport